MTATLNGRTHAAGGTTTIRGVKLTQRQWEYCQLIADGWNDDFLADKLYVTRNTAIQMVRLLYRRFGLAQGGGKVPRVELAALVWSERVRTPESDSTAPYGAEGTEHDFD